MVRLGDEETTRCWVHRTIMKKALCIWNVREELRQYLLNGLKDVPIQLTFPEEIEEGSLIELAEDAEVIIGWRPSPDLLSASKDLRLFINPGAGVQHLVERFDQADLKQPVTIVNGHGNSYFTAQHTVAILLALLNKVVPHHQHMLAGHWRTGDKEGMSTPLRKLNVGLLGYGHVNRLVHRFLSGFDLSFSVLKRTWPVGDPVTAASNNFKRYAMGQLHDFLHRTDILIVAVPLTGVTEDMIDEQALELLGPNGYLVNVGRGKVVNEEALYHALKNGSIKGAAIDVWYDYGAEPDDVGKTYPYRFPFHELDNLLLSPHRAASPMSDLGRWDEVIENLRRYANGELPFLNEVDLERGY